MAIAVFVPGHLQAGDFAARFGDGALHYHGVNRDDPQEAGQKMCRRYAELQHVLAAGGHQADLCQIGTSFCQHHENGAGPLCGVRRQAAEATKSDMEVVVFPHSSLGHRKPEIFEHVTFDAVCIDEGPWLTLLGGFDIDRPYRLPESCLKTSWASGEWALPAEESDPYPVGEKVDALLSEIAERISNAASGRLSVAALLPNDTLLSRSTMKAQCRDAASWVYRAKIRPADVIELDGEDADLEPVKAHNGLIDKTAKLLSLIVLTLEGEGAESPYLSVVEDRVPTQDGTIPMRFIVMRWRINIHPDWAGLHTLYTDATGSVDIAKSWLPNLTVTVPPETAIVPEGVIIRQVEDRPVSFGMIRPDRRASAEEQQRQINNCGRISRRFEYDAHIHHGAGAEGIDVAAIMPKATRAEVQRHVGGLERAGLGHFNNVRGYDGFKGVAHLALYGRPEVSPAEVENRAWVMAGKVGISLNGAPYQKRYVNRLMADGTGRPALQVYHPDPYAEAGRLMTTEFELIQCVARARHVWKSEASPLTIMIGTNVPLPFPVKEVITWDQLVAEAGPVNMMIARGVIPGDWRGVAAVLQDQFPSAEAARAWFKRNPDEQVTLDAAKAVSFGHFPMDRLLSLGFDRFSCRRKGDRQGATVLVSAAVPDQRGLVERYLGPLDRFDAIKAPRQKQAPLTVSIDESGLRHLPPRRHPLRAVPPGSAQDGLDPSAWFRPATRGAPVPPGLSVNGQPLPAVVSVADWLAAPPVGGSIITSINSSGGLTRRIFVLHQPLGLAA